MPFRRDLKLVNDQQKKTTRVTNRQSENGASYVFENKIFMMDKGFDGFSEVIILGHEQNSRESLDREGFASKTPLAPISIEERRLALNEVDAIVFSITSVPANATRLF